MSLCNLLAPGLVLRLRLTLPSRLAVHTVRLAALTRHVVFSAMDTEESGNEITFHNSDRYGLAKLSSNRLCWRTGCMKRGANAQKLDFISDDQPPVAEPPSVFSNSNRVPPTESRFSAPVGGTVQLREPAASQSASPIGATDPGRNQRRATVTAAIPVNLSALQFKTLFGPVSIPVSTIEGVRMADDPRQPATICLTNSDSLTGVLTTDSVTIKTAWGGATIGTRSTSSRS